MWVLMEHCRLPHTSMLSSVQGVKKETKKAGKITSKGRCQNAETSGAWHRGRAGMR
jgi:hypothetical protein